MAGCVRFILTVITERVLEFFEGCNGGIRIQVDNNTKQKHEEKGGITRIRKKKDIQR